MVWPPRLCECRELGYCDGPGPAAQLSWHWWPRELGQPRVILAGVSLEPSPSLSSSEFAVVLSLELDLRPGSATQPGQCYAVDPLGCSGHWVMVTEV